MTREDFENMNSECFELVIEVVLPDLLENNKILRRYLPESFLSPLSKDPRSVLKGLLNQAMDVGGITADEAHYLMRFAKFNVVSDVGGKCVTF